MTTTFLNVSSIYSHRLLLIAMSWLMVVTFTGTASAEDKPGSPPVMDISFQNNLISAELVDAPLIDVLQRIKQELGFKAHFYGDLTEKITLSVTDVPLDKFLRQLTDNHSLSVAFLPTTKLSGQDQTRQIAEIWVLSRSTASKSLNIAPAAPIPPLDNVSEDMDINRQQSQEEPGNEVPDSVPSDQVDSTLSAENSSQRQTIDTLTAKGDSASVMTMAEYLGTEENKDVRRMLVQGISSIQNEESTQVLGQVIRNEPDPEIRMIAIRALGQRQNDSAARSYLEQALNDEDTEVKAVVSQLLAQ